MVSKHQGRIEKRKEDEIVQTEKSKHYVSHLDEMDRLAEIKEFKGSNDKILANMFVSRHLESKMTELTLKYETFAYSYKKLCSYRSFDESIPNQLVLRFLEHDTERVNH